VSEQYREFVLDPLRSGMSSGVSGQAAVQPVKRPKRGNPLTQFLLLSQRNVELLKNDRSLFVIMLLQAPLIALFLMLLIRFEVGTGIFDPNKAVQCAPQIFTSSAVSPTNPAGTLGITPTAKQKNDNGTVSCNLIQSFLKNDAAGKSYAQKNGGEAKALQDFIVIGDSINAQRALFLCAFIAVLFGVINSIREIVKEGAIYRRERTVNLGIVPYLFSKILILGVLALFQSGVLILIVHAFEPLHQGVFLPVLLEGYITLALASFAGVMIGLAVSAVAPNEDSATSLLPIILIPQVIFAGVEIPLKDALTTTAAWFFPTRWAMAGLGSSLGLHADKLGGDKVFGDDPTYHGTLFSIYSQTDAMHRMLLAWGALGLTIIILTIVTGIILKRKDVRK
ncbi:MAG TPA: ABC transporter permease, partial [Ktedonobacteraceae bacterium]|nr:ABC transporter permease [Ktedonobacteraceae bacterium]